MNEVKSNEVVKKEECCGNCENECSEQKPSEPVVEESKAYYEKEDPHYLTGFSLVVAIIFLFFFPPISVFMKRREVDKSVLINVIFLLLGWILSPIHAVYVLFFKED